MMALTVKLRFPLLLMLGVVFLALVCASSGISCNEKCLQRCNRVNEASRRSKCRSRCEGWPERCEEEEEEEEEEGRPRHKESGRRERARQEGEREEEEGRPRHKETGRRERARQEGEREEEERQQHPPQQEEEDDEGRQQHRRRRHRPQHEREKQEEHEGQQQRQPRRHGSEEEEEERQHRGQPQRQSEREQQEDEDEGRQKHRSRPQHEREQEEGRQHGWEEEEEREHRVRHKRSQRGDEREKEMPRHRRRGQEEEEEEEEKEEQWRGRRRHDDPEERERFRRRRETERRHSQKSHRGGSEEEEEGSSESHGRRNPFFFRSNRFQTIFNNENGQIRLLQRFDKRSNLFQNLQNYRLVEYRSKPHTILLPQHTDADFILVVLRGKAILTIVNPNDRNSFNLEPGDAIKIPAGTLAYLANPDNDEDLKVLDLAIPVNKPGRFQSFFPFSSQNQQSYFNGFSRNVLEASFNTKFEEIERVLLEEHQEQRQGQRKGRRERQQSEEANPIVKVSREQIEELSKHAKSSSRKSASSQNEPFNLRSRDPIYSNKFGKFFEITPNQSPQLQDLGLFLSCVEINEGALMLPHYNSRANVILVVNEGKGHLELVGLRNEQQKQQDEEEQQEEGERTEQVHRYRARLSPGDVFIIPSSHPVVVNASSDLSLLGFGINAMNNQRNFLAGEEDNVISQIHKQVKALAFPGSAQEIDRLIKNQRESHFADGQPQQKEEGSQRKRSPLSSILGAFY